MLAPIGRLRGTDRRADTYNVVAVTKPAARRFALPALSLHAVGMLLVPLAAIAVALVQPVDFDYWWQRRTGEYIVAHLAVPRTDPFSFTMQGRAWVDHEWLSQVLMYLANAMFGYLGLFLLFMALGVAAWWLVYRLLRAEGLGRDAGAGAVDRAGGVRGDVLASAAGDVHGVLRRAVHQRDVRGAAGRAADDCGGWRR